MDDTSKEIRNLKGSQMAVLPQTKTWKAWNGGRLYAGGAVSALELIEATIPMHTSIQSHMLRAGAPLMEPAICDLLLVSVCFSSSPNFSNLHDG